MVHGKLLWQEGVDRCAMDVFCLVSACVSLVAEESSARMRCKDGQSSRQDHALSGLHGVAPQ